MNTVSSQTRTYFTVAVTALNVADDVITPLDGDPHVRVCFEPIMFEVSVPDAVWIDILSTF